MNIELVAIAATSGLLAGVSACTLPLYPIMLNQLTRTKEDPRLAALFFTFGLGAAYFLLYLFIGTLSAFLGPAFAGEIDLARRYLLLAGALFSWLMAWRTFRGSAGGFVFKLLDGKLEGGILGAFFSGFGYGAIVTPCNAPFLVTGIVPALASRGGVFHGVLLLAVFSIAVGSPLLLLGWASGTALLAFAFVNRHRRKVELVSAAFLVVVGFYFLRLFMLSMGWI